MLLRIQFLFIVALLTFALPCCAQTGTLTFYFAQPGFGQEAADGVLPVGKVPFTGFGMTAASEWRMQEEDDL